jgi:hypothetical protein
LIKKNGSLNWIFIHYEIACLSQNLLQQNKKNARVRDNCIGRKRNGLDRLYLLESLNNINKYKFSIQIKYKMQKLI